MQDSLITALLPALMTAPGGFVVIADPTLLLNPEIRAPIVRHILLTQPVQAAILEKAENWADGIIAVMGKPSGIAEDESETFHASVVSAIGRMLAPAQIDLLIHDHDYFRCVSRTICTARSATCSARLQVGAESPAMLPLRTPTHTHSYL